METLRDHPMPMGDVRPVSVPADNPRSARVPLAGSICVRHQVAALKQA